MVNETKHENYGFISLITRDRNFVFDSSAFETL